MAEQRKMRTSKVEKSIAPRDQKGKFVSKATSKESRIGAKGSEGTPFSSSMSNQSFFNRNSKKIGYREVRNMSIANNVVRIVINAIKNSIMRTTHVVRPKDLSKREEYKEQIDYVTKLLNFPDQNSGTFRTLFSTVIEDVLVLDQGVIEKVRNPRGEIVQLYQVDGATIRPRIDQYGLLSSPAYVQYIDTSKGADTREEPDATFEQDDLIIFQANPQGQIGRVGYGMSPVEYIIMTVSTSLQAMLFNARYFDDAKIPPFLANLKNVPKEALDNFRESFEQALRGNPWAGAWTNAEDFKLELLRPTNQEMQFYELNMWLIKIIFGAFEMSPSDFGFTDDVNRATAEVQERIGKSRGVQNILTLIAERINYGIIADLARFDSRFAEIEFGWDSVDLNEDKLQAEIDEIYLRNKVLVPNEVRARDGREELEGGDVPISSQQVLGNPSNSNLKDNEEPEEDNEEIEEEDSEEETKKSVKKSLKLSTEKWDEWYK